jgi:REP element-mobilizing transposase RayT
LLVQADKPGMRIARCTSPNVVYHVISRFVDREWRFRDQHERALYLHYLAIALERCDWLCLAYALMSNHIHLALLGGRSQFGSLMKRVHSPFALVMNKRHARLGPVMADRPAAWAIREGNEKNLIAYIHNNPVRAGVVGRARDSRWTSHAAYCGEQEAPRWLAIDEGLRRCGMDNVAFDRWVDTNEFDEQREDLAGIGRAARKRGAIALGTPVAAPTEVPLVGRPFARIRPDPRDVVAAVGAMFELAGTRVASRSNQGAARDARRIAVHCAVALGLTASEISSALGITRQAGSFIARRPLDDLARARVTLVCERFTTQPPSPAKAAQRHG